MSSPARPPASRRLILPAVALAVVLADQLSKFAVRQLLAPSSSIPVIPGVLHLTHVLNPGAAFGLLPNGRFFFFAATGAVIAFIIVYYLRARPSSRLLLAALGLELGGATGNLIDRSASGLVTDFIDFRVWPVFNVADSAIVVGLALLALVVLRPERRDGQRDGKVS